MGHRKSQSKTLLTIAGGETRNSGGIATTLSLCVRSLWWLQYTGSVCCSRSWGLGYCFWATHGLLESIGMHNLARPTHCSIVCDHWLREAWECTPRHTLFNVITCQHYEPHAFLHVPHDPAVFPTIVLYVPLFLPPSPICPSWPSVTRTHPSGFSSDHWARSLEPHPKSASHFESESRSRLLSKEHKERNAVEHFKRLLVWFFLSIDHRLTLTQIDTPSLFPPLPPTPFQWANDWGYRANYNSLDSFTFSSVILFLSRPTTDRFRCKKTDEKLSGMELKLPAVHGWGKITAL